MESYVGFSETPKTQVDPTLEACEMDEYDTNVPKKHRGTDADRRDMQIHGRKQELHRIFGFVSMMGFGSTLICTWEILLAAAVTSSLTNGGTAGLLWGFVIVAVAFMFIYASLAEMASMSPVSCGQYHWVSEFSPRRCQKYLSYLTGWLCTLGWQTGLAGGSFMVGTIIQGLITLNVSTYEPQPWHGTLIVIAVGCFVVGFNTCLAKKLPFVEGILLMLHVVGLFAIIIPLWVLAPRNNTKAVFTEFTNNGGWPTEGVSFMVGLLPLVISVLGFDSTVHMSPLASTLSISGYMYSCLPPLVLNRNLQQDVMPKRKRGTEKAGAHLTQEPSTYPPLRKSARLLKRDSHQLSPVQKGKKQRRQNRALSSPSTTESTREDRRPAQLSENYTKKSTNDTSFESHFRKTHSAPFGSGASHKRKHEKELGRAGIESPKRPRKTAHPVFARRRTVGARIQSEWQDLPVRKLEFQPSALRGMTTDAGYKRCSPPALGLLHDPVVDGCYMPESQISNPRKRQHTEQYALQPNGTSQPQLKRQKLNHPTTRSQPPAFWDNLSRTWLTRGALRELNRRNNQPASSQPRSQHRRTRRPVTRNFLAELKKTQFVSDYLRHCEPGTSKDIKQFARYGGPDLSDLKGFPEPVDPLNHIMSSSQSSSRGRKRSLASTLDTRLTTNTTNTRTTESSGPYSRNFQQKLIDGGVYPDEYEYPDGRVPPEPDNLEEINGILTHPRPSLSPSQFSNEKFKEFKRADAHVSKENKATKTVIPIIEGKIKDGKCVEGDVLFTNLTPLTNDMLTAAKPDLYYGARPEQLNRRVRDELSGHIIPSTQDDLPIVPNFFLAAKGPNGTAAVARRQACYDGALGARGMYSLQSYEEDEPVHDNNAYTITSIYSDGQLKMYTSHPTQPTSPEGRPEYCMTQLKGYSMTSDPETFRKGATAYRNARDWTKEQRDEAIKRANEKVNDSQVGTLAVDASFGGISSFTTEDSLDEAYMIEALSQESRTSLDEGSNIATDPPESETSTDKLTINYSLTAKRLKRHSKRSHQLQ
ncbi:hypothetical protein EPUS_08645 [Endocarpon pusillum Z07020]|uniref:Amino acid permease/ SLC12A domain-containing protein n=1 Tax=Endocarpon pusillum (strain Z07020 / HMAS-L-300199) TaxID=1263415 RepID=U1GBF4_ENDPU|nr:uncharacterized protein EPUS_08645 [Endocarpon pusillum Z07020]ERF69373.1 hypothetical protein EPUS_08645 [Endocarpon pusillum Z07020]